MAFLSAACFTSFAVDGCSHTDNKSFPYERTGVMVSKSYTILNTRCWETLTLLQS
ncbi:hypothetical protein PF005_g23371 [Phytophthora fragariae]|uniref:Uncharacterized protein n=1 Tax=Phytophthora fragariae TaxID=53985 RepID=A0A6A4ABB8_9STRA|nr:hypothetical protein PF003_g1628 [Phytophthora fragariae]KAE8944814.1 hypothetical protein PF009_g5514 [Phytophthora fragariae]KAE8972130.1 hypothetical protein PF011_g25757 [Phytophthora fragariae]KAE9110482.1 hypothetical protein PF006_g20435 [Phytophthora fragariae]KAE9127928.1 hypothetical protein PF010_g4720 [Phytophthora fragariae]